MEGIPYSHKSSRSVYADMPKEEKMKTLLKRIEEDKVRAQHQLPQLKKSQQEDSPRRLVGQCKCIELDKSSGLPICVTKIAEQDGYYVGCGNGKIIKVDILSKTTKGKDHTESLYAKCDNAILALNANPTGMIAAVDDTMHINFFENTKLLTSLKSDIGLEFVELKYGKLVSGDSNFFYYINGPRDKIVKVNPNGFQVEEVNVGRKSLFDFTTFEKRVFAISEEGYIISAVTLVKEQMNADEHEAYPDGVILTEKEILKFNEKDLEAKAKFLREGIKFNEEIEQSIDNFLTDEKGGETQYIQSIMDKSNVAGSKNYVYWENTFFGHSALGVINYHSIGCSEEYVAVCVHDGKGLNCLCLYSHALVLKALKLFRIDSKDFTFNLGKSCQKMRLVQIDYTTLYIFMNCQKLHTMYIFKYDGDKIALVTKLSSPHTAAITDFYVDQKILLTVGKDKKLALYPLTMPSPQSGGFTSDNNPNLAQSVTIQE